jgi:hypothetical protein
MPSMLLPGPLGLTIATTWLVLSAAICACAAAWPVQVMTATATTTRGHKTMRLMRSSPSALWRCAAY